MLGRLLVLTIGHFDAAIGLGAVRFLVWRGRVLGVLGNRLVLSYRVVLGLHVFPLLGIAVHGPRGRLGMAAAFTLDRRRSATRPGARFGRRLGVGAHASRRPRVATGAGSRASALAVPVAAAAAVRLVLILDRLGASRRRVGRRSALSAALHALRSGRRARA